METVGSLKSGAQTRALLQDRPARFVAEVVDVMVREDLANSAWRPNETVKSSVQPCSCAWEWSAATSRDRRAFVSVRG